MCRGVRMGVYVCSVVFGGVRSCAGARVAV